MSRVLKSKLIVFFAVILFMNCFLFVEHKAEAATKRLSVESGKLWINKPTTLKVTLENRKEGEELEYSVGKKSSVKINVKNWKKDSIDILITPLKENSTILTIKFGNEKIKVKLYLSLRNELTAEQIYEKQADAMVEIKSYDSNNTCYTGSGFFVGDGKIVTNYHVIENASRLEIKGYHGENYKVTQVYGYDTDLNLAMIGVQATNKKAFIMNTEGSTTGAAIYTIGSPLEYTGSFSEGMISYAKRKVEGKNYIQMTAATSTGSGGGPLINSYGEVIGVNAMTILSAQNINFAIPISKASAMDISKPMLISEFYKENKGKLNAQGVAKAASASIQEESDSVKTSTKATKSKKLTSVELYQKCADSLVEISIQTSDSTALGSGFFIEKNKILTNYHVIEGASQITVKDYAGKTYKVDVIYDYNIKYDIAVLGVVESGKPLLLNENEVLTGEEVYTIGSPYGYTGTFSKGIISLALRRLDDVNYIQITAPLSKGNSGGPLLNEYGEVVGVNTLSQLNGQNINFAVKISYLKELNLNKPVSILEFYKKSM